MSISFSWFVYLRNVITSVASLLRNVQLDSLSMYPVCRFIILASCAADIKFFTKRMKVIQKVDCFGYALFSLPFGLTFQWISTSIVL